MPPLDLSLLLLQLVVIVAGSALFRTALRRAGQPGVLGEILFGLLLGASFLGWAWPAGSNALFPQDSRAVLNVLGWIGLILFMFTVGAETRWSRRGGKATVGVGLGGLLVPFALGLGLAAVAPSWFFEGSFGLPNLVLVAVIMAVSALPVLGRILKDAGMLRTRLGAIVMGAGTLDDVFAWALLAMVAGGATVGLTGNFAANVLLIVTLLSSLVAADAAIPRLMARFGPPRDATTFAGLLTSIFAAAWITDAAGLNAVIGPMAMGALVSRHPQLLAYARPRLAGLTMLVLMPTFFVLAGLDTNLTLLGSATGLAALAIVVAVASLGKVLGCSLGGRAAGLSARESVTAGILLNARGAVGLVVAKIGLDRGLLSAQGFAVLVLAIVLTTCAAPPALRAYQRWAALRPHPRGLQPPHDFLPTPEMALAATLHSEQAEERSTGEEAPEQEA